MVRSLEEINRDFIMVDPSLTVKEAMSLVRKTGAKLIAVRQGKLIAGICDSHFLLMQSDAPAEPLRYSTDFKIVNQDRILTHPDLQYPYFLLVQNDGDNGQPTYHGQ